MKQDAPLPELIANGDECWMLVWNEAKRRGRVFSKASLRTWQGAARVRVERIQSVAVDRPEDVLYRVRILAAASDRVIVGDVRDARRGDLYLKRSKTESAVFAAAVRQYTAPKEAPRGC